MITVKITTASCRVSEPMRKELSCKFKVLVKKIDLLVNQTEPYLPLKLWGIMT